MEKKPLSHLSGQFSSLQGAGWLALVVKSDGLELTRAGRRALSSSSLSLSVCLSDKGYGGGRAIDCIAY